MDRVSVTEGLFLSDVHVGCPFTESVWTSRYQIENLDSSPVFLDNRTLLFKGLGISQLNKTSFDRQDSFNSQEEKLVEISGYFTSTLR